MQKKTPKQNVKKPGFPIENICTTSAEPGKLADAF